MAKKAKTILADVPVKTNIERFIEHRLEDGKLTQVEADALLAGWNNRLAKQRKKDTTLSGKNVFKLNANEQLALLSLMAFILNIADEQGGIL